MQLFLPVCALVSVKQMILVKLNEYNSRAAARRILRMIEVVLGTHPQLQVASPSPALRSFHSSLRTPKAIQLIHKLDKTVNPS